MTRQVATQLAIDKNLLNVLARKAAIASTYLERTIRLDEFIHICLWYANLHHESVVNLYKQTIGSSIVVSP